MVKSSFEQATVPPPSNGPLYEVHLYYPNNFPLAKSVGQYLKKNIDIQDHMITTFEHSVLTSSVLRHNANLIIVEIDEFCHQETVLITARTYFDRPIPIITHATLHCQLQLELMKKHHVIGFFIDYDFHELARLIQKTLL